MPVCRDEAKVCFAIYRQWIPDLNAFLAEQGVPRPEIDTVNAEIVAKLALPDGRPWDPFRQWHDVVTQLEELVALVHREQGRAALAKLEELKETWRRCHDRDVDHTYGLMSAIVRRCRACRAQGRATAAAGGLRLLSASWR